MAALFLGKNDACGSTPDLDARYWIGGRFVLILMRPSILVSSGDADQEIARRTQVHRTEDRVFQRFGDIPMGPVEPFGLPSHFCRAVPGEKVVTTEFQCLAIETGIAAAQRLGHCWRCLAGCSGVSADHIAL